MWLRKKKREDLAPWEMGPPVVFAASEGTPQEKQQHMIQARQSMGIVTAKELVADGMNRRADRIMLDFTRDSVAARYDIDGVWHQVQPLSRQDGDLMLAVLKTIATLNVTERRARQHGRFDAEYAGQNYRCTITSQGTKTGERVVLQMAQTGHKFSKLDELGMREKMCEEFKGLINRTKGLILFSAPPTGGLKTTWNVGLSAADRYMRDFTAVESKDKPITDVENVDVTYYDTSAGEPPDQVIGKIALKLPDVICVPELPDGESLRLLCQHVNGEDKMAIAGVRAKEAPEALLRALMLKPPVKDFAQSILCVLNTRLIRKLCEECKQPYEPHPQLLKKLGVPPNRVSSFFREWQPPPPGQETRKGKSAEPEICPACEGLGYHGRTAIFELLVVNDKIRQALIKKPKLEVLRQLARQGGVRSQQEEGIVQVVQGVTSLNELQRFLKQS